MKTSPKLRFAVMALAILAFGYSSVHMQSATCHAQDGCTIDKGPCDGPFSGSDRPGRCGGLL